MSTLASVIIRDLIANLPAAGIPGRLFFARDTGAQLYDTGSAWDSIAPPGGFSTQIDVTGSRSTGTVFHNTSGLWMLVQIEGTCSSGGTLFLFSDGSNPPTTEVGGVTLASTSFRGTITCLIPPGHFYELTFNGGAGILRWIEST